MIGNNYIFNDIIKHYLGDGFPMLTKNDNKVNTTAFEATTIDEYLVFLIKGYINVTLDERLEKYLFELIKDKWFHQWPLVRWACATRFLYNSKTSEKALARIVEVLMQLCKEGCPCALSDMAYCYRYGIGVEASYEKAICLWVLASRKGYHKARDCLKMEYELRRSKELSEELRLLLVNNILRIFIEEHSLYVKDYTICPDGLSVDAYKRLRRICNENKKLYKTVRERAYLRHCGQLCWSDEENPYNIGVRAKEK